MAKASFSQTSQTANKRRRQKKRVKIFLNFTYLQKTQPGHKTVGNFQIFFEDIYSPDRFGGDIAFPMGKIGRGLPSLPWVPEPQNLNERKLVRGKERRKKGGNLNLNERKKLSFLPYFFLFIIFWL